MSEAESRLNSTELRALRRYQYAHDRQRHRALQRAAAAYGLLAALYPVPPAGTRRDHRLRRDVQDPRAPPEPGESQVRPAWRLFPLCRQPPRPEDRRRPGPRRPARPRRPVRRGHGDDPQKLGCVGHITSGCPRDLDEVRALGFQLFGLNPCVSHAYTRLVEFDTSVLIGGVEIHCGDLIHADKHGVCLIPHSIAHRLAAACAEVERRERPLLDYCTSDDSRLDVYIQLRELSHAQILEYDGSDRRGGDAAVRRRPPRTAGCGRWPRRDGPRRAASPRRATGPCGTRTGPWRAAASASSSNGRRLEVDADQGEQVPGLPVARPEDLVVPLGRLPPLALRRVGVAQGRDEPRLQPFALLVEQLARVVHVHVLDDLPEGTPEDQPQATSTQTGRMPAQISNPMVEPPATSVVWRAWLSL